MTTTTWKFAEGEQVAADLPPNCLTCDQPLPSNIGTVVEHGIYHSYVVTLESATEATGYDPDGKPVHVCGLRLICNEDELRPVTWHRNVHDACPACGGGPCEVYASEDQANAALDHETLERMYEESGTTLSPAEWVAEQATVVETRDPQTTTRHGTDNTLDTMTSVELAKYVRDLASTALGYVQAAQSDRPLYDMLLDLDAATHEALCRSHLGMLPEKPCGCERRLYRCPGCGMHRHEVDGLWICVNPNCRYDR